MPESTILLVSADVSLIQAVDDSLRLFPHLTCQAVAEQEEALLTFQATDVILVLVHLRRKNDSVEVRHFLQRLEASGRPLAALLLHEPHLDGQVTDLTRTGIVDCLSRPFDLARIASLANELAANPPRKSAAVPSTANTPSIQSLGEKGTHFYLPSTSVAQLMEQVERIAPQDTTILLTGETGTGKTHLARQIHELSQRRDDPFLVVHCGALSANLIESEMFGHVRGAFTGADRDRIGKFAAVGRGTILLDEIDTLPIELQTKLLRVVDERVFEPVGSNNSLELRARLIAASNRVITDEVQAGRFRADLLYRLNVVEFHMQPLRQKPALIPFLAKHFVRDAAARCGGAACHITDEAMHALQACPWPGNIRQLRNVIERAVALCPGPEIKLADLPDAVRLPRPVADECRIVSSSGVEPAMLATGTGYQETEITRIRQALYRNKNNRRRAAHELGISRMTLYNKLHRYGLIS